MELWKALDFFGLGAEAFGVDGNFDGNKFFCYYPFLARRSFSFVFRVSDCHQIHPWLSRKKRQPSVVGVLHCGMWFLRRLLLCCGLLSSPVFSNLHSTPFLATRGGLLAKPNYQFEKRQRDLAKKAKQEEKRRQKLAEKADNASGEDAALSPSAADVAPSDAGTPKA